jgi:2-keto-4-pentenoate hydratase/2-oxohepta-3-ene-1,7-dioic acid hydratase in catechol pathway
MAGTAMTGTAMTGTWALTQYRAPGGPPQIGVLVGDVLHRAPADWPATTLDLFEDWAAWSGILQALDTDDLDAVDDAELLTPITYPRKLLCAGANYYDHAEEMGTARPDPSEPPFFFLKPPTTTLIPSGTDIVVRDVPGAQLDWEIELAVVIADRCRDVDVADARSHIAGYAVTNDVSARGRFPRPNAVFPPFAWDWLGHKGFDGSNPIGPIVPAWLVPDPQNLSLRLSVNGEPKQDSSTASIVVGIDQLVAAASRMVTLEPGDVIMTGTPAGVGMPRKTFLNDGDIVVAEIEGLGRVENRIVSAP